MVHKQRAARKSVANLTLTIDADLLRRARIRALERGTSVNAIVREYLESFTGTSPASAALGIFRELSATYQGGTPGRTRIWTRDELHDRPAPG